MTPKPSSSASTPSQVAAGLTVAPPRGRLFNAGNVRAEMAANPRTVVCDRGLLAPLSQVRTQTDMRSSTCKRAKVNTGNVRA